MGFAQNQGMNIVYGAGIASVLAAGGTFAFQGSVNVPMTIIAAVVGGVGAPVLSMTVFGGQ